MLTNPSQLLLRNKDLTHQQDILILNHENDLAAKILADDNNHIDNLALDYHHHLAIKPYDNEKLCSIFGHKMPTDLRYQTVILYFPKEKSLASYLLNLAAFHLRDGGQLILVGVNKGGIRSCSKLLPEFFSAPLKRDSARHCSLFTSVLIKPAPKPKLLDWCSNYQLTTPSGSLTICNLVGVFSEKHLDPGTELLLEHLPKLKGRVLDFGCGAGVISASLLQAQPELSLECIDINALALASCELTLAANNLKGKVYPSDGLAQTQGKFNAIISNPPFHDGLKTTTSIADNFIKSSKQQLHNQGLWQIVANHHLPYAQLIEPHFSQAKIKAKNNKYKIYSNQ